MKTELRISVLLSLFAAGVASAQDSEVSFKSTEVAPGIFMLEGQGGFTGGNLGLLIGDEGVVLIDDGLEPLAATTLEAVSDISGKPVDFVINTHVHGDHLGGNEAFYRAGATIISQDNTRSRLIATEQPATDDDAAVAPEALPQITFSQSMTFHMNGHEAFVFHVPSAHTDGDAIIFIRDANVLHTGDALFNGIFPFIDLDAGGSVAGYIAAQKDMLSLAGPETRIIPGHGPVANKADLQAALDMLVGARDRVQALVDDGRSEEEVLAANPLEMYHEDWNWQFITTERMTRTLYQDLTRD
jgi:glyoxylase-like metal-dependent hydrolase (beta-lactamase superfamily II)